MHTSFVTRLLHPFRRELSPSSSRRRTAAGDSTESFRTTVDQFDPTPPRAASPVPSVLALCADTDTTATSKRVLDLTARAAQFVLSVKAGLLHNAQGEIFETLGEEAKFVMLKDRTILGSVKFRENGVSVHHSSFTKDHVAAAGLACVQGGKPRYFICDSGHYQPTPRNMAQFLRHIKAAGVDLTGVLVGFHGTESSDFLWVQAEDAMTLDESAVLSRYSVPGPDRTGKKDKSQLSRTSTRSTLVSLYRAPNTAEASGGSQRNHTD